MQILNLINKEKSDINYTIMRFPDGEPHIVLEDINRKDEVFIKCRITNPIDLFILMQVGDILNRQGVIFTLEIYYLMSMRMDRVIDFNESYSLNIVANIINSLKAENIFIIEPHSYKTLHCINNSVHINGIQYISNLINFIHIYPDVGAVLRYRPNSNNHVICSKIRNINTGKLSDFTIENPEVIKQNLDKSFIVIDDLCDRGGTFIGIANEIRKIAPDIKLDIYVTHMVNPEGITNLSKHYNNVYFTNSYKDWQLEELPKNVNVIDIINDKL